MPAGSRRYTRNQDTTGATPQELFMGMKPYSPQKRLIQGGQMSPQGRCIDVED